MDIPTHDIGPQIAVYRPTINHFVLQTLAMCLTAFLIPGLRITSFFGPIITVLALAAVNATVWDAQLFFSLPLTVTESTISIVVANAVLFWILVKILPGIEISGILPSLIAPILFTIINMVAARYVRSVDFIELGQKGIAVVDGYRTSLAGDNTRVTLPAVNIPDPFSKRPDR